MITEGEQGIAFEVDRKRINPEGVYRYMQETGHCPLRDYDIERLGRAFGLYVGTMRQFIKKNGLDARLEDEVMGKVNYSEVEDLYNQGKTDTEIAKALKISLPSVSLWRKRNGLQPQQPKTKKAKAEIRIEFDKTKQLTADEEAESVKAAAESWVKTTEIDPGCRSSIDAVIDDMVEEMRDVITGEKEEKAEAKPAITPGAVEAFRNIFAPSIEAPDPWEIIEQLEQQILFLRGVAIGAGVRNIDELLEGIS